MNTFSADKQKPRKSKIEQCRKEEKSSLLKKSEFLKSACVKIVDMADGGLVDGAKLRTVVIETPKVLASYNAYSRKPSRT